MKTLICILTLLLGIPGLISAQKRVLIYNKTARYVHASIPDGIRAVQELGKEHHFGVDTTSDSADFTDVNLAKYAAIVCISTNPARFLDSTQKQAFVRFIQSGKGFLGVHSASAGAAEWPWYARLVGAVFANHPEPQEGTLLNLDKEGFATRHFPDKLPWKDEWYNYSQLEEGLNFILAVDESSYIGGTYGARVHPVSWYREWEGGRTFYTALGHFSYHYTDTFFRQHLLAGLNYVMANF